VKWEFIERPLTINPKEFSIKKYQTENAIIERARIQVQNLGIPCHSCTILSTLYKIIIEYTYIECIHYKYRIIIV